MSKDFPKATPHGPLTEVAPGVHAVRGTFRMGPGLWLSRTMTVVQTDSGLVIVNAIRLDPAGEAALARLGKVQHVVTLSDMHGLDDPYYVHTFGARFWTVPGARPKHLPVDLVLDATPIPGAVFILLANPGRPEGALWLPHGQGTLVTCDALQNHVDSEGATLLTRLITPLLGFKGGVIVPRLWRKAHRVGPAEVATVFAPLGALAFERLITAHGPPVTSGADLRVREAVARVGG